MGGRRLEHRGQPHRDLRVAPCGDGRLTPLALAPLLVVGTGLAPGTLLEASGLFAGAMRLRGGPAVWSWAVAERTMRGPAVERGSLASPDLAVCAARRDGAWSRWTEAPPPPSWGEALPRLFAAWAGGASPVSASPYLWAEWDAPVGDGGPSLLYAGLDDLPAAALPDLSRAFAALTGDGPSWGTLRAALAGLPAGARPMQVGSLAGRGVDGARLFVAVPGADLADWLRHIRWPGDSSAVEALRLRHGFLSSHVECHVDFAPTPLPRTSVSLFFPLGPGAAAGRWRACLDRLVDDGLLAGDEAGEVAAWVATPDPPALRRGCQVKLVVADGRVAAVKLYLVWSAPT